MSNETDTFCTNCGQDFCLWTKTQAAEFCPRCTVATGGDTRVSRVRQFYGSFGRELNTWSTGLRLGPMQTLRSERRWLRSIYEQLCPSKLQAHSFQYVPLTSQARQ